MAVDPGTMQQLLIQKLGQNPQAPSYGGGAAGPQMQGQISPMAAGANIAQKLMLMRALQQRAPQAPQQPIAPTGIGGFPLPQGQVLPQTMNAQPVPTVGAQSA